MKKSTIAKRQALLDSGKTRFMRPKEYADRLGISERTLRDWLSRNLIPYIKIGERVIFIDPLKADAALARLERKELVL